MIASEYPSIPYLYISANVANMPEETALTPLIADFFQQLLETLPQHLPQQVESESDTSSMADTESLLTGIESKLMINILLSVIIQSSALRFEAHQQRAGAMDLLLRLPSLKLVASAHNDSTSCGLDISLSLRSFSVCFYNPHQPSPLDAFALTLDKIAAGISRKSTPLHNRSHVKITCAIDIGHATFTYDMRKLSELIAFPSPWYRRRIAQSFLLGQEHFPKTPNTGIIPSPSKRTKKLVEKPTLDASVQVNWEAFKAKIQMSSAMGETNWTINKISTKVMLSLQPFVERRFGINFVMSFFDQQAQGGAISGSLQLSNTTFDFSWVSLHNKPTTFSSAINISELEIRLTWMGRVVIVALFELPSLLLCDDWSLQNDHDGKEQIQDSRMLLNLTNQMPLSVNKNENKLAKMFHWATILDLITDIQMKSRSFPMPNATNGRTIITGRFNFSGQQASLVLMEGEITANRWALFYLNQPMLIFSNAAQYTFLDENQTIGIDLTEKLLLKLNGPGKDSNKLSENNWTSAICKVEPMLIFSNAAQYTFLDENQTIGIDLTEKLLLKLNGPGKDSNKLSENNWTSAICKVERNKDQTWPKDGTIRECLKLCINEPLTELFSPMQDSTKPIVLELFELPEMDSVFTSNQRTPINCEKLRDIKSEVLCSVICDFHYPFGVQTDLTTQINFLPELLRSYLIEQDKEVQKGPEISSTDKQEQVEKSKDKRHYICKEWKVDPKIRFIDKVKWDPPVIDEILRKLQIFDHRNTIPKVIQRHILDQCDIFASKVLFPVVKIAKKASIESDPASGHP
uniref:Bridge-like lipid transfer protein family member 1 C-terminal domain-containing protein n=1 Tax=Setaria digitata TaxID=48799 RepID=A0A915PXW3_9BILA